MVYEAYVFELLTLGDNLLERGRASKNTICFRSFRRGLRLIFIMNGTGACEANVVEEDGKRAGSEMFLVKVDGEKVFRLAASAIKCSGVSILGERTFDERKEVNSSKRSYRSKHVRPSAQSLASSIHLMGCR